MKKILLRISLALLILLGIAMAAGAWYIQKVFLPTKLKPLLIESVARSANLKIDLENIVYKFPNKFSLYNLILFEKDIPTQKLLSVQETTIVFNPIKILLKKQVSINRVGLKTLQIYPGPGHTFTSKGDIFIDGEFSYNLNDPKSISYGAILTLKDQDIKNMPLVKDIANLNGRIKIEPDEISIIQLKGSSYECPVEFSGRLENFKDPYLDLTETIDLDLSKINNFLSPKINKSLRQISFAGKSAVALHMSGKFSEWPLKFSGQANVLDAEAKIQALANPIKNINGAVSFDENSLLIPQLQAQYNEQPYSFKANLTNYSAPSVYAVLSSQDLLLETKLRTIDDYVKFDSIEASWFNSSLSLVGEIQNYQNPQLKISGDANIDLQDLQKMFVKIAGPNENVLRILNNLNPKGICNISLFLDGLIEDFKNCEFGVKADSENINLNGFNLGASQASCQFKEKILIIPKLDFMPYDGRLKVQAKADFAAKDKPASPFYEIDIYAENINLEKLIKDTAFKDKNVWGTLAMSSSLNGAAYDLNNLRGHGWIMVSNGHLWEFPLLGGIANALQLPMLTKVEIKEATGNFMVKDKKVLTQNLQFLSPQFNMLARGSLGFYGELNFNVGLSFTPGFAQQNELAKLAILLVDEAGRFIGELKISGTLKEPKYNFVPLRLDKLIGGHVIEGIKKLFKKQR